ncbi:MAG: hypothetical protein ACFFCW_33195 [Candidatus Hodarchaeota archaeon]
MERGIKSPSRKKKIVEAYLNAKETVIELGFGAEIDWQDQVRFSQITERDFLREAAWVVLSSGMREAVILVKFPAISSAFYSWRNAKKIVENPEKCQVKAFKVFRHQKKIDAIISIAARIFDQGFKTFKGYIEREGVSFIQSLPFMGPATSYHLAKNIGLDVVKPDRHLVRVATAGGYDNPMLLCKEISEVVGDRISVVDIVIWRFATLDPKYIQYFV